MKSWVAIDRMAEEQRAYDLEYRKQSAGRPLRSDADRLTDDELLAKLRSLGIEIDRPWLDRQSDSALSAEEIAKPLIGQRNLPGKYDSDWIWICLTALWKRWFPQKPSFEALDDKIQEGYELQSSLPEACNLWLSAWSDILHMIDKAGLHSIEGFDDRFQGTQPLFNWMRNHEIELWNAGARDPLFHKERIAYAEEALRRFDEDGESIEYWRLAMADSYWALGETGKAEALFRDWVHADLSWGHGWIGWADSYSLRPAEQRDLARSEQILRQALAVPEVRNRQDILWRLADAVEDQGRTAEARPLRRESRRAESAESLREAALYHHHDLQHKTPVDSGEQSPALNKLPNLTDMLRDTSAAVPAPVTRQKVGRNEPCPCGSGKKYKKCCGA